ncbi:MAG: glycosyltransferase N-terminal domain-containing protein [Myxococcota bacterium]
MSITVTQTPWGLRAYLFSLAAAEAALHRQLVHTQKVAWSIAQARGPFPDPGERPWLWAHAASGGDVRALRATLEELQTPSSKPLAIYLSVVTTTGYDAGLEACRQGWVDAVAAAPIAMPGAMARLWPSRPQAAIVERLEFWPTLLAPLAQHQIPWVLHNARMSDRSAAAYRALAPRWWPWLLSSLRCALVQDRGTRERLTTLAPHLQLQIHRAPFAKLAAARPPTLRAIAQLRQRYPQLPDARRCLVAGSLHQEDLEQAVHGHDGRPMVVAPRYPEQATAMVQRLRGWGLEASVISSGRAPGQVPSHRCS